METSLIIFLSLFVALVIFLIYSLVRLHFYLKYCTKEEAEALVEKFYQGPR